MLVLHMTRPSEWARNAKDGAYRPASLDEVGHIYGCRLHFATIVANSMFRAEPRLTLVAIDSRHLDVEIRWDGPTEMPMLWPNIAGPLNLDAVVADIEWTREGNRFPRVPLRIRSLDCGPDDSPSAMESADAIEVISVLSNAGVTVIVEGGWAVDALVGHQTRPHSDLDVAIPASQLDRTLAIMNERGFEVVTDERPVRVLVRDSLGRKLDLHPRDLESRWYASVTTAGVIEGHPVVCLNAQRQMEQHRNYELGERDYADVEQLQALMP